MLNNFTMINTVQKNLFVFDFDSTLVKIESLDELLIEGLRKKGKNEVIPKIEEITNMGMNGEINLKESIEKRLALAELKKDDIQLFKNKILKEITPGIEKIISWLQAQGHAIFIISGGFLDCILPVAKKLNIPKENCFGNSCYYNQNGSLTGIDQKNPLVRSNGKCQIISELKKKHKCPVVIIGDGFSDLIPWQNKMADYFLGFGVNIHRPKIQMQAENYFTTTKDLLQFIKNTF